MSTAGPHKNIVLCSDGTGNRDVKARGTNVFKLYEAVDIQGFKETDARRQVAFYDDGIGTSSLILWRILGGAFGLGFARNIRQLYMELAQVYEPGDRIYLFGFSRGAYTVRALAGMIHYCGILDVTRLSYGELSERTCRCLEDFKDVAFRFVASDERRSKATAPGEDAVRARQRRLDYGSIVDDEFAPDGVVPIEFVGVWDTVGAVGVPFDWLETALSYFFPIRFADLTPASNVRRACHALSIDDARRTFHPEMWNESAGEGPSVEQVWFAGAHSNVGGGYPKQGLSLVALDWMMTQAECCGLRFIDADREYVRTHQDVHGTLYEPRAGLAVYYRWAPRDIARICRKHASGTPKIHVSVLERIANGTDGYAPGNVPFAAEVVTTLDCAGSGWPDDQTLLLLTAELGLLGSATSASPGGTSLLERKERTVRSGIASYWCFVAITLVTVGTMPPVRWLLRSALGLVLPPAVMRAIAAAVAGPLWMAGAAVIAALLVRYWAGRVDESLERTYDESWSKPRAALRDILGADVRPTSPPPAGGSVPQGRPAGEPAPQGLEEVEALAGAASGREG
jgi:uncharacterized protein (DUF2235 family)